MKYFGPFKDESADFRTLGELFLLCGDTGAGKTSVFDAMSYALYGQLLGARKGKAKDFVSKFAPAGAESSVEFEFEAQGGQYRVFRTLPYTYLTRSKKLDEKDSSVSLEQWNAKQGCYQRIEGLKGDIDRKIEALLGLSFVQFTKVVILPQGDFANFLKAKSKEKTEILRKLFPVEQYEKIAAAVKEKAALAAAELEENERNIRGLSSGMSADEFKERIAELERTIAAAKARRQAVQEKREKLIAEKNSAEQRLTDAVMLERTLSELNGLRLEEAAVSELENHLALSKEAAFLAPYIENKERREKERKVQHEKSIFFSEETVRLKTQLELLEEKSEQMLRAESDLSALKIRLEKLNAAQSVLQSVSEAEKKYTDALELKKEAESALVTADKECVSKLREIRETASEYVQAQELSDSFEVVQALLHLQHEAQADCSAAAREREKSEKYSSLRGRQSEENLRRESCEDAVRQEKKQSEGISAIIADMERRKRLQEENSCALMLVPLLKDGMPCPVCGSYEHPSPARPLEESLSLDEQIAVQKKALESSQEKTQELLSELSALQERLAFLENSLRELEQDGMPASLEQAERALAEAERRSKKIDAAVIVCSAFQKQLKSLQLHKEECALALQEAEKNCASQSSGLEACRKQLEQQEACEFSCEEIQREVRRIRAQIADSGQEIQEFKESLSRAQVQGARAEASAEEAARSLDSAQKQYEEAVSQLKEKLSRTSFSSAEEAGRHIMTSRETQEAQSRIEAFHERIAFLQTQADLLGKKSMQDRHIIEDEIAEKNKLLEQLSADYETEDASVSMLLKEKSEAELTLARLSSLLEAHESLSKRNEPLAKLDRDVSGHNPKMIKLDTWFLGIYFSDVIRAANSYLLKISAQRYEFKLNTERSGGVQMLGLDLLVHDYQNGHDRDTSTLSGGETFIASVSLALGLTEVINSRSRPLESLFIDEGFGSLDRSSLDMAVGVLQDVGGHKTVGIISHIEELKSAVPSHIEVIKRPDGSHIIQN